ncbi:hypothetical protein LTS10_000078 [Elasticomyces elasticus]|nr:hypothetical protein LTS10_000078 [Elasticomyces elasticus]
MSSTAWKRSQSSKYQQRRKPITKALMEDIWLATPGIAGSCHQLFHEVHESLLNRALQSSSIMFVIKVVNFDFRRFHKFFDYVTDEEIPGREARFQRALFMGNTSRFKVDFHITDAPSMDAKKLGCWIEYRRRSIDMPYYRVSKMGKQREIVSTIQELASSFGPSDEDFVAIADAAQVFDQSNQTSVKA